MGNAVAENKTVLETDYFANWSANYFKADAEKKKESKTYWIGLYLNAIGDGDEERFNFCAWHLAQMMVVDNLLCKGD